MLFLMYSGTIHFDVDTQPSILTAHLAECLRRVHARQIRVEGNRVSFRGGCFRFVTNWNVLGPFGYGELEVDMVANEVRYRLSLAQLVIVVTVLVLFLGSLMLFLPLPKEVVPFSKLAVFSFCLIGWVWFVGGNLLIGIARFTGFLRQSIAGVPTGAEGGHQNGYWATRGK